MKARKLSLALGLLLLGAVGLMVRGFEFVDDDTPVPAVGEEGGPDVILSVPEMEMWISGRRVFDRDFHSDRGLGGGADGDYNGDSCRACHQDPVVGGAGGIDLNVSRFAYDHGGSGPFENLPGGQIVSRLQRADMGSREEYSASADVFEQRQAPSVLGLGLIEQVPDSEILGLSDPQDLDGDGIRGVPRIIDMGGGIVELGLFGWKAGVPTLADFAKDAMGAELGITVSSADRGFGATSDGDPVADPELDDMDLADVTFFMEHLGPPPRGGSTSPLVANGEALFEQVGCGKCHTPTLTTPSGPIHPYSNFLLHDVHPATFRGMAEPGAPSGFYRTPPLWGISRTGPYMHDGSAETLTDSILAHDGESRDVRLAFEALTSGERQSLIVFLEDL